MPLHISILLATSLALAFLLGAMNRRSCGPFAVACSIAFSILIILKAVVFLHPAAEASIFPLPFFAFIKDTLPFFFAMLTIGHLLSKNRTRNRTRSLILLAALLTFATAARTVFLSPAAASATLSADSHHQCLQSTLQTCAPAACVSALSYINISSTESAMAQSCLTTSRGTTDYNTYCALASALQAAHAPFRAHMAEFTAAQLAQPGTLAVISVDSHSHAICTLGTGTLIIVQDPLVPAPQIWTLPQLTAAYSGIATIISPIGSD